MMNTCSRCGGKFPTRTSGIDTGAVTCMSADQCDRNLRQQYVVRLKLDGADVYIGDHNRWVQDVFEAKRMRMAEAVSVALDLNVPRERFAIDTVYSGHAT